MVRRVLLGLSVAVAVFAWFPGTQSTAEAQRRVPVSIESDPSGAKVYVDSADGQPIGTTPIRVARIPRGNHTLIFKKDNHETAKLNVRIWRRRETFRAVLKPLATLVVSPGNDAARSAAVVVDGEPKGNVPFQEQFQPGRHQVQVRRDGYKTFEQWVQLEGGQTFTLPVMLEKKAPSTGSLLVAGDVSGAPVFLDGEPNGVTPTVIEDVPKGEHKVEVKPDGREPFSKQVRIRPGERTTVTPTFRAEPETTGSIRVLTTPGGATVSVDGEAVGQSPVTKEELSPGEHIVEATADGYQRGRKTVKIESGQQRVISLDLQEEQLEPGKIQVNATVDEAQVTIDGQDRGAPPVVIQQAEEGTHSIIVSAPGYQDFRETCEVAPGRDCKIMARMKRVGTPVTVSANADNAEFYVDGELKGPVPFEGDVPVGSHRIEVRAPGYESHVEQVQLRPQSEAREFDVELVPKGAKAQQERRAAAMEDRMRMLREATSLSAATLPPEMTIIDASIGWPWALEARLGVGILDYLEAGFAMRSTIVRLHQFEGRVKMGWRPIEQIALGGQLRFGGSIGPSRDPKSSERQNAEDMGEDPDDVSSHPTNNVFMNLELLGTLHFSRAGAFTLWVAADMYSDRWDWCGGNRNKYPANDGEGCGDPDAMNVDNQPNFRPGRQKQARLRLGGALEIVLNRRWNVYAMLEGIIADSGNRRLLGDMYGVGTGDTEIYFRLGFSHKFGRANQVDVPAASSSSASRSGSGARGLSNPAN